MLPRYIMETEPLSLAVLGAEAGPVGMPLLEMLRDRPYAGVEPGLATATLAPGDVEGSAETGLRIGLPTAGPGLPMLSPPGEAVVAVPLSLPPTTGMPGGGTGNESSSSPPTACSEPAPPATSTSNGIGLARIRPDTAAPVDEPTADTRPPPRPMREPDAWAGEAPAKLDEVRVLMEGNPASPFGGAWRTVCIVDARAIAACLDGVQVNPGPYVAGPPFMEERRLTEERMLGVPAGSQAADMRAESDELTRRTRRLAPSRLAPADQG